MTNCNQSIKSRENCIFRNQPSYTYFDKPFEDEEDCLFQHFHEIDPHFTTPEQKEQSIDYVSTILTDPRTQKAITRLCYDHTKEDETEVFNYPKKSLMSEKDHELGVRVLQLLEQHLEVEEEDLYNWYRLTNIRLKENQYFKKFVSEFNRSNKEQIYAPCKKLLQLYQKWYFSKAIRLMKRYPQEAYNVHLGLPRVRDCKNTLRDQQVTIENQEIVSKVGEDCSWQDNIKQEFIKFNYCIGSYCEVYENSEDVKESLEDSLQLQFGNIVEQEFSEIPAFYIPLDSLLFLLTAGDYVDVSKEVLFDIKESQNDSRKYIIMDPPLPSRQCGWHTYGQVVEQATLAMNSLNRKKLLQTETLQADWPSKCPNFKVLPIEEFIQKSKSTADKLCKFSKTLVKWQLSSIEGDHLEIYTSLESFNDNKLVALKLEHKPKLGCEMLTKYEMLREWLKVKLIGASKSSCLRISTLNYQNLLEEPLSERKLEERLITVYQLNCKQLLNNLFEFLKILCNMPVGHYMLRYNPKYREKLMLCRPSLEITQNTIYLNELLNTNVTDMEFMSQQNELPIDETLCSLMHLQHKILPCSFSPCAKGKQIIKKKQVNVKKKVAQPVPLKEYVKRANHSRQKRIRRRQREFAAIKQKVDEKKELEREIELDRKMLNF